MAIKLQSDVKLATELAKETLINNDIEMVQKVIDSKVLMGLYRAQIEAAVFEEVVTQFVTAGYSVDVGNKAGDKVYITICWE